MERIHSIHANLFVVIGVVCFLLLLSSVSTQGQAPEDRAAKLEERIMELRRDARFAEALEVAKKLLALRQADDESKAYQVADAERLVRDLKVFEGLPQAQQEELARADALSLRLNIQDWYDRGYNKSAEDTVRQQLKIRRKILGSEHPEVAESLNNLAVLLLCKGDYEEAESLHREALAMRLKLLGKEHPCVAESLHHLTELLHRRGFLVTAELFCRESLALNRKLFGDGHAEVAACLHDLASVLTDRGSYAEAEPLFHEALALRRKLLGDENVDVAETLNNLAVLLRRRGDYEKAEALYRESLALRRKLFGDEHPRVATILNNLARLLFDLGDYAGAEPLFREALAIRSKSLGDEQPPPVSTLNNLAVLLREKGNYAEAEQLQREAASLARKTLGDTHPRTAIILTDFAMLLQAMERYSAAESVLVLAADIHEAARWRFGSAVARATFNASPYKLLAHARLKLGKTVEAWPAAEQGLGRALADMFAMVGRRRLSPAEAAREDSLKQIVDRLERELAVYRKAAKTDTTEEAGRRVQDTQNFLLEAEARRGEFQSEIAAKYTISEGLAYPLNRIQATLNDRTAIVGWIDVEERRNEFVSWCYVIRDTGPVVWEQIGASEGRTTSPFDRMKQFSLNLVSFENSPADIRGDARLIWNERFAPISNKLVGVENLIVIPSQAMLCVPVEALVDEKDDLVCDDFAISYAPSATTHAWLFEHTHTHSGGGPNATALLVGDPPYDRSHLSSDVAEVAAMSTRSVVDYVELCRGVLEGDKDALARLPRLPATRQEVNAIGHMFSDTKVLIGLKASEQTLVGLVQSGELGRYDVLHLAAHAIVDDEQPERSTLILSQIDLPDALEAAMAGERIFDGMITAEEILREWELDADLVTLSGCQTALGKAVAGEGYIGLAHAFLQVGARSLLVSLWDVEDRATSLLMQRFYQNYTGSYEDERGGRRGEPMPKAQALAEAKRWLRTYTDPSEWEQPYAHPYYWAGFILIGDPF